MKCALHGIDPCPLCLDLAPPPGTPRRPPPPPATTSPFNMAFGTDGNPLPYSPEEVTAVCQKALQDGDLIAAILRLPTGDLAVQVFGPPSHELVDMLEAAASQYKRAIGLQLAPPAGRA